MTDENETTLAEAAPEPPPVQQRPVRVFAPTKFRKLPVLTDKQLAKLSPQLRAKYVEEKRHEDDWGHLPPNLARHMRGMSPASISPNAVELHAKAKKTDPVHFAAAKAFHKWGIGQEMEPSAYDDAIEAVLSHKHGV